MGNLTRKQKKNLRDLVTGLSGCAIVAAILISYNMINRHEYVPVVFSDILDGAKVTAGTEFEENPVVTLDEEYLYETLFDTETIILTTTPVSTTEDYIPNGAGGTLLVNTTEITVPAETTSEIVQSFVTTTEQSITAVETTVGVTTTVKPVTTTAKATTTTAAPVTSTSKTPFTNVGGGVISRDEDVYITMLNLVNEARVENGLDELWYSARVHEIATQRAYELSSYYSHNRSDGRGFHTAFSDNGIQYKTVGENIAYGRNMFETVEEVFQAWMDSPSHRENILSPDFECVGFGLAELKVGNDRYYYWSQEFATF